MHPFNKLASPFCLFMPNLGIPTVYFYQPNKGTLAELLPGSLWFCTPWWWFHSGVFTCHTQQRRAPGTFRVDMCAWDKGKTEVIWKLVCFCSYKFGFSYPVAGPALQNCEVNKACFCHPHLPLAPSSILSVSNQLPSCQSLPRAQSSGWSGVTIGAVAPGQPGWAAKMYRWLSTKVRVVSESSIFCIFTPIAPVFWFHRSGMGLMRVHFEKSPRVILTDMPPLLHLPLPQPV